MRVKLPCGCTIDDEQYSTVHEQDGRHYPIGAHPANYCYKCDLFKPCACTIVGTGILEGQPYLR